MTKDNQTRSEAAYPADVAAALVAAARRVCADEALVARLRATGVMGELDDALRDDVVERAAMGSKPEHLHMLIWLDRRGVVIGLSRRYAAGWFRDFSDKEVQEYLKRSVFTEEAHLPNILEIRLDFETFYLVAKCLLAWPDLKQVIKKVETMSLDIDDRIRLVRKINGKATNILRDSGIIAKKFEFFQYCRYVMTKGIDINNRDEMLNTAQYLNMDLKEGYL